MRSDILNRHMKIHDKHVEVEPLSSVTSSYIPPVGGSSGSFYKPTYMDKEVCMVMQNFSAMFDNLLVKLLLPTALKF